MQAQPLFKKRFLQSLSEHQSKLLLAEWGIPCCKEELAKTRKQAIDAALRIGLPVAMKACSPTLPHKTQLNALRLDLKTEDEITEAYDQLSNMGIENLEGILVQEMVQGNRELVLGMVRDPQFGAAVMLGLGGVMTEVFEDIAFRAAPFDQTEALDMVDQLSCAKMLGPFRGQESASLNSLANCLVGLGELGLARPEIREIDINPVKIDARGNLVAVDALVVLEEKLHA